MAAGRSRLQSVVSATELDRRRTRSLIGFVTTVRDEPDVGRKTPFEPGLIGGP